MAKVKVLTGKDGIRKAREKYVEAQNLKESLNRDCKCPYCGHETCIDYIDICYCGEIVCIYCRESDYEGETLCKKCSDATLHSSTSAATAPIWSPKAKL